MDNYERQSEIVLKELFGINHSLVLNSRYIMCQ